MFKQKHKCFILILLSSSLIKSSHFTEQNIVMNYVKESIPLQMCEQETYVILSSRLLGSQRMQC